MFRVFKARKQAKEGILKLLREVPGAADRLENDLVNDRLIRGKFVDENGRRCILGSIYDLHGDNNFVSWISHPVHEPIVVGWDMHYFGKRALKRWLKKHRRAVVEELIRESQRPARAPDGEFIGKLE